MVPRNELMIERRALAVARMQRVDAGAVALTLVAVRHAVAATVRVED
jgi:hypothetical protein